MSAGGPVAAATRHADAPTAAFDLDGTLAHTAPDIARAINVALVESGLDAIPFATASELVAIGAGARKLAENALRAANGADVDAAGIERLVERYLAHYLDAVKVDSALFPGVRDALEALRQRGHRLVVCTNKPERHARLLLDALEVTDLFDAIAGFDTYAYRKPDGRHVTTIIEAAGGDPRNAVMVGDSHVDIAAARDAGIPVVCVSFGYNEVPIAQLSPDRVIDHFDELVDAIESLHATNTRKPRAAVLE